ncbi:hypothetical protein NX029_11620 [Cytobacillus firmus]|nr:hypothetical protein [Cytobacillus firmus]
MEKKFNLNLMILVFGLFLVLAACSAQTETEGEKTDPAPATESGSTEDSAKDNSSEQSTDTESDGSDAQTKPLAEMTLDDLTEYFKKIGLIKENAKIFKVGGIGSDAIQYEEDKIEVYWFDFENMDETIKQQYEGAKKDGYVTLQPSGTQIMFEVHGPFGVNISNSSRGNEFLKAVKDLK